MSASNFLVINEQTISLEQALNYLQVAGKLDAFLLEMLYQHAINQELTTQTDLNLQPDVVEEMLINFRVEHQLTEPETFQAWLVSNEMDHETFRQQLVQHLKLNQLKAWITQPKLQDYFDQRRLFLEQVILSWIRVDTKDFAKALRQQIKAGAKFERLAKAYAVNQDDRHRKSVTDGLADFWQWLTDSNPSSTSSRAATPTIVLEEPINREEMPDELREAVDAAQPGSLIGPLAIEDDWYVFQLVGIVPAELDEALAAELEAEIFQDWLTEKVAAMTIKLQLEEG